MPAVSLDLRRLFLRDRQAGHSIRQIARQYGVSHTGVHRIPIRLEERETLEPKKQRHGPLPSWAGRERELLEAVEATPDATLAELCVGLKMSVSVLDRALRVLKITRKKKRCTPRSRTARTCVRPAMPGTGRSRRCPRRSWCSSTRPPATPR